MPKTITDTQQFPMSVVAKTSRGKEVPLASYAWSSSDPSVLTVTADPGDPSKATAVAVVPGIVVVSMKGDADPSDGVVEIIGTLDVVVGPGMATIVEITAGEATEQPAGSPGSSGSVIPA